jgi:NAD-specific glutamate dehydrogenase
MYLDLRNASWCWWDACQLEFAELVIVLCHGSLSLEHLDEYGWLIVLICGECLTLLCWDNSVSGKEKRKKRERECVRRMVGEQMSRSL